MNRMSGFRRRAQERGAAILLVAGSVVVLVGMTAFAVDIGRAMVVRGELQNVADASALAGASRIGNYFEQDWASACDAAEAAVTENTTEGNNMLLGDADIETGVWSDSLQTFTPLAACNGTLVNADDLPADSFPAVRVVMHRDAGSASGAMQTFFAPVLGSGEIDLTAESIAVIAAASTGKATIPFVIGSCSLAAALNADGSPNIGYQFTVVSAQEDAEGCADEGQWTAFCTSAGCDGANKVKQLIANPEDIPALPDNTTVITEIQNGYRKSLFKDAADAWAAGDLGPVVLVPVVSNDFLTIGGNPEAPIINYIAVEITDIKHSGQTPYISFEVADPVRVQDAAPDTSGSMFAGAITSAILVN